MISARDLRPGVIIMYNGVMCEIFESQHHKPGKGGAFIKTKMRNLSTGSMLSETLRPEDTFDEVFIEQRPMQYLYRDSHGYCFMDEVTYEQIHIPEEKMGDVLGYLKENMIVTANMHDNEVLTVAPPIHVTLKVATTEPGFRGNTVTGANKPATLETGKVVRVPLFVETGDMIKVDTRTGTYIERA